MGLSYPPVLRRTHLRLCKRGGERLRLLRQVCLELVHLGTSAANPDYQPREPWLSRSRGRGRTATPQRSFSAATSAEAMRCSNRGVGLGYGGRNQKGGLHSWRSAERSRSHLPCLSAEACSRARTRSASVPMSESRCCSNAFTLVCSASVCTVVLHTTRRGACAIACAGGQLTTDVCCAQKEGSTCAGWMSRGVLVCQLELGVACGGGA